MNDTAIRTLETLRELCGDEGYKIIDAEDILSRLDMDADSLFETIDILDTEQLVAVKYSDKTEYCLSITKTGILKAEEEQKRRQEEARRESERLERYRLEQSERERAEQRTEESTNKKGSKAYRKKERETTKETLKSVALQDAAFDGVSAQFDTAGGGALPDEPIHARQTTLVLREVMLNRETMRAIARVAFFSGLIGAAIGSLIVSLIFVFL